MPVTTYPAAHKANAFTYEPGRTGNATSASHLLQSSCEKEFESLRNNHIIQSSFAGLSADDDRLILPSENGFVRGAIEAYSAHRHLVIRPDDVWLAILTQLSLYINANAEDLREKFVAHEGQKELEVIEIGTLYTVDFGALAYRMGKVIEKNVIDPDLRKWVMPDFSTTTVHDSVVASVVFMGTMQKYFSYRMTLMCGIPSVTLLGEKADWQKLESRLEKLKSLGAETEQWRALLAPVLRRFVKTFDAPESDEIKDFWQKIADRSGGGSGPSYYSGWITTFCFWNEDGKSMYSASQDRPWNAFGMEMLSLDGVAYHYIKSDEVPPGYSSVPVTVDDNGISYNTTMVAGSVAWHVTSSGQPATDSVVGFDTLRPFSGWWIFERKSQEEMDEEKRTKENKEKAYWDEMWAKRNARAEK